MYLNLQSRTSTKKGGSRNSSSFFNAATITLLHTISESEKKAYVAHINSCFEDDPIMKRYLPIDPSTNDLFEIAKDGVLLWYTFLATKVLSYNNNGHRVWI